MKVSLITKLINSIVLSDRQSTPSNIIDDGGVRLMLHDIRTLDRLKKVAWS